jgi:hypothetical protein
MSLISDALKKAQRERTVPPSEASAEFTSHSPRRGRGETRPRTRVFLIAKLAVVIAALVGGIAFFHGPTKKPDAGDGTPAAQDILIGEVSSPSSVTAVPTSPPSSLPPAKIQPVSSAPPTPQYDLAGMTVVGPNTLLSISRRSDRRSVWIPVGKTVGEVTALSYDPRTDRAVIEVEGRKFDIKMRDGSPEEPKIQAAE